MRKTRCKTIILAVLMMTFIGQAFASINMSCEDMNSSLEFQEVMSSSHMDHSQMMGIASDNASSSECNTDCECTLGGCNTAVVPVAQQLFVANLSLQSRDQVTLAVKQLANSLYRPPISH